MKNILYQESIVEIKHLFHIMKITALALFIFVGTAFATESYSQVMKVTVVADKISTGKVINEIEKQTDYLFVYNVNEVNLQRTIQVNAENKSVAEVLNKVFEGTNIYYAMEGKNIMLMSRTKENQSANQTNKVTGVVKDTNGETIIGANVTVKGQSIGTITDIDGRFVIDAPADAVLQITYIGYTSQEINIGNKKELNIILKEDAKALDEVVVVGYGVQKKVNLTGSVSNVTRESIENRPITQTSQALAGLTSGITVSQSSGRPGGDQASLKIRGVGTFSSAGSDPLVLIDGLSGSINDVDPNNIESISVLKDAASAAIYGTRAANGVILIETKRGKKGTTQVSYNGYVGWQTATQLPDLLDSWDYAAMRNEADRNDGLSATYSQEDIQLFKDGTRPDKYPNVNHLKDLVTSGSGFQTGHNVTLSSGSEKLAYLFSIGYLHQNGIVEQNSYSKYNMQLNVDNQILNNLQLKANLSGYVSTINEPYTGDGDMSRMIGLAVREYAAIPGRKSDGTYGYQDLFCPEGWLDSDSFRKDNNKNFTGGTELVWEPLKGLIFSGKVGYNYSNYYNKKYISTLVFDENKTFSPNSLSVSNGNTTLTTLQFLTRYSKRIKKHHFEILLGASQEEYRNNWGDAYRKDFPNDLLYELNAGSTNGQTASGSSSEWGLRSFFGRINYSFMDKYLLEVNARYDGTSRFPTDGRWGLFPSVSLGWRISEESFIKDNLSWIDNLKLRASWGKLGNQNIGNYPYQNVLSLGVNYPFGNTMSSGAAVTTLANHNITWETTSVFDLGIDFTILGGKFDFVFDYFDKRTSDILYNISVSSILGMTPSEVNAASVKNTGIELSIRYNANIGNLKLHLAPNFSYFKNQITSLANGKEQDIDKGLFVGKSLDAIYGYVADGLFIDQADIDNYPSQPYNAEPGFVRYKDISGPNGIPDGKVDATYDRKVLGSTIPKFSYGFTISGEYKGLDFSLLLQGLGGFKKKMGNYQAYAFYNNGNIQRWQMENRWTEENPNRNAEYIKLTALNDGAGTIMTSSYWLRNGTFLRAKNLQIGYTLPTRLTQKINIDKARIYFSGQNLFCINSFYKGWDPELSQEQSFYPITAVYSLGVNLKF
ncbi:TonB-dependent receptor [Bacteroides cellulosilyticus]|uniref:TonB-dependent receptor n=1 Tax=Bacteroides cellulosilyticus TaxID=246787 RepID=UPI0018A00362|nr:TonB-dependent receptor [Bacteroides cellulosilyticus]